MQCKYLQTDMCGSYYVDCDVLAWDVSDDQGKLGAIIRYYDDVIGDYETRWTEKSRVKTPPISEWLGM